MTTMARFSGFCPECGGRWEPGDLIRPVLGEDGYLLRREQIEARRARELNLWQHAVCPDEPDDLALRRGETVCPSCWLTSCDCEAPDA